MSRGMKEEIVCNLYNATTNQQAIRDLVNIMHFRKAIFHRR